MVLVEGRKEEEEDWFLGVDFFGKRGNSLIALLLSNLPTVAFFFCLLFRLLFSPQNAPLLLFKLLKYDF